MKYYDENTIHAVRSEKEKIVYAKKVLSWLPKFLEARSYYDIKHSPYHVDKKTWETICSQYEEIRMKLVSIVSQRIL